MKIIIRKIKFYFYRLQWHLAPYINFKYPLHLDLELTSRCNLNCSFCFRQDKKFVDGDMDVNKALKFIHDARRRGVKSIKFNFRGEATLHKEYTTLIKNAFCLGYFIYVNTSLSWAMPVTMLKDMAKYVDVLKVSFDSCVPDRYEKIRKGARFSIIIGNLWLLYDFRIYFEMPKIVLSRRRIDGMESDKYYKEYFGHIFKYDIRDAMPRNKSMIKRKSEKDLYFVPPFTYRKYCKHPSRRLIITWNGNIYICCVNYHEALCTRLGNINKKRLKDLWSSDKRKEIIRKLKKNDFNNLKCCKNCTSKDAFK